MSGCRCWRQGSSLVEPKSRVVHGTLLLIGSGVLADSLAKLLAGPSVVAERATCAQGPATTRVLLPDLIVLAGDAAQDRGKAMLAKLAGDPAGTPISTLVIAAQDLGGLTVQPAPRQIAFLGLEGGTTECARRVRLVAELYFEAGLATCSLQQLVDTVAPQLKQAGRTPAMATTGASAVLAGESKGGTAGSGKDASASAVGQSSSAQRSGGAAPKHVNAGAAAMPKASALKAGVAAAAQQVNASAAAMPASSSAQKSGVASAAQPSSASAPATSTNRSAVAPATQHTLRTQIGRAPVAPTTTLAERAAAALDLLQTKRRTAASDAVAQATFESALDAAFDQQPARRTNDVAAASPQPAPEPAATTAVQTRDANTNKQQRAKLPSGIAATTQTATHVEPTAAIAAVRALDPGANKQPRTNQRSAANTATSNASPVPITGEVPTPANDNGVRDVLLRSAQHDASASVSAATQGVAIASFELAPLVARVASPQSEVVISLSEPLPASIAARDMLDQPAPLPAAAEPDRTPAPRPRPRLQRGERPSLHAAPATPDRNTASKPRPQPSPRTAAVEPQFTISFSDVPPATSTRPAGIVASPQLNVTPANSQHAPRTGPGAVAPADTHQPSRGPKARRAVNPLAAPQASPPRPPLQQTPWSPLAGFSQPNVAPPAQNALAALLAAEAAAAAPPPSAAQSNSFALQATMFATLVACCSVLGFMWLDRSSREAAAAIALASLHAGSAARSPSSTSNSRSTSQAANTHPSSSSAKRSTTTAPNRAQIDGTPFDESTAARSSASTQEPLTRAEQLVDEGALLFEDGRLGLAEASYLKALKTMPSYPRAMAGLVRVHIERKDGAEAVRWAEQLVASQPQSGPNQLLLGDARALRGDDAAARAAWNRAIRYGSVAASQRLTPQ